MINFSKTIHKIIAAIIFLFGAAGIITISLVCGGKPYFNHIQIPQVLLFFAAFIAMFVFLVSISRFMVLKNYAENKKFHFAARLYFVIVFFLSAIGVSYIPCHDSLDLHNMIYCLINSSNLSDYQNAYLNFTVTNKIIVYIYSIPARLFGNVKIGVQVLNFALVFGTIILIAKICKQLFGKHGENIGILLLPIFAPYIILSGPYIYPVSIFLASLALFLFFLKNRARYFSLFVMGLLFTIRPTALASVLVIVFMHYFSTLKRPKDILVKICSLLLIFVSMFAVKQAIGAFMYTNGIHAYPQLNTAAGIWAFELGTRPNPSEDAGSCFYTAYALSEKVKDDDISNDFNALWHYYEKNNISDLESINILQGKVNSKIFHRTVDTIKTNPVLMLKTMFYKFSNFYGDVYKPYYAKPNITQSTFKKDISNDYDRIGFLYENILYAMFFTACIISALTHGKNKYPLYTALGVFATSAVFLLLTEVTKKYMFDFYPAMIITVFGTIVSLSGNSLNIPKKLRKTSVTTISSGIIVLIFAIVFGTSVRTKCFDGADFEISTADSAQTLHINGIKSANKQYKITCSDGSEIDLSESDKAEFKYSADTFDAFTLNLPTGDKIRISSQDIPQ